MHATLVDRKRRRIKGWVRERPDGNAHEAGQSVIRVVDSRSAGGTEKESECVARFGYPGVFARLTRDSNTLLGKSRLCAEDTAGSSLACGAVAHGYADWLSRGKCRELSTTARCLSAARDHTICWHRHSGCSLEHCLPFKPPSTAIYLRCQSFNRKPIQSVREQLPGRHYKRKTRRN